MKHLNTLGIIILALLLYSSTPLHSTVTTLDLDHYTNFPNPERGFYHPVSYSPTIKSKVSNLTGAVVAEQRDKYARSLFLLEYYLGNFREDSLTQNVLDIINSDFDTLRTYGAKAIVRFAYTSSTGVPYKDGSPEYWALHLRQLKPVLHANEDVISCVQAGFLGVWGEWYYSNLGTGSRIPQEVKNDLINELLDAVPASRSVQLRTPDYKQVYLGKDMNPLTPEEAFTQTPKARLGHHNDAIMNGSSNMGTYKNRKQDMAYLNQDCRYLPNGGETDLTKDQGSAESIYKNWSTGEIADKELGYIHFSYLNHEYSGFVLNKWKEEMLGDQTYYNVISCHLGYRFGVEKISRPEAIQPGGNLPVNIVIKNEGYAAPYNERHAYLVLKNETDTFSFPIASDPRLWEPENKLSLINETFAVPAEMPEGKYDICLYIPDLSPRIAADPRFAIRFANIDCWEETSGYNNLHLQIEVSPEAPANPKIERLCTPNAGLTPEDDIQEVIDAASAGDTVYLGEGVFNQRIVVKDGVSVIGVYKKTFLDGTNLGHNLIQCDQPMQNPTVIKNLVLQYANTYDDGGGAYITKNVTLCDCIVELCYTKGRAGAIFNMGGLVDRCIARGCSGVDCSIWNDANGIVRNCLMHNNEPSADDWPDSGGIYNHRDGNLDGIVTNCTAACNYGRQYAGWHSESVSFNILTWNNQKETGFSDKANYISDSNGAKSKPNASDDGNSQFSLSIGKVNCGTRGVYFVAPTPFVGVPKTEDEIAAMRAADFHLMAGSYIIDRGNYKEECGEYDLDGKARMIGEKVEIGCYEYDPNAPVVALTGLAIKQDTFFVKVDETALPTPILIPENTTDRHLCWSVDNKKIASVSSEGLIKGVSEGETVLQLASSRGHYRDYAVIIVSPKEEPYVCPEVLAAEQIPLEDYTVPSYIPMWEARYKARFDSCQENLDTLALRINQLVPKTEPYCVVANINGDPRYNMAFCWFTNPDIEAGEVQIIAAATATPTDFETAKQLQQVISAPATTEQTKKWRYAVSNSGILKRTGMPVTQTFTYLSHKVMVTNLQPGTSYCYRVGYEGHWSDIRYFRTADEQQGEYSFVYMTDSHIINPEYVSAAELCATALAKNEKDIRFCLFPGDFVDTGGAANSEWEWERWFEQSMKPMLSIMPVAPTDGNHDDSNNYNYTMHFNTDNAFNKMSKVKPQFQGITYSFMYGDVLFLVYSHQDYWRGSYSYTNGTSNYLQTDVANWFKDQVAAHPEAKWRIGLVHQAVFAGSGHQTDEEATLYRSCMIPIFKDIELDVLLQGHDHCYETIGPVDPDTWKVVEGAVADVEDDGPAGTTRNMTGKKGGTYTVNDGTLYFIGATCGEKRYEPFTRAEMEEGYDRHKVENYFDLFTGMFGQPGAPSYTRFTVKNDCIEANSFKVNEQGESVLYNTFRVKRTKEHTAYTGLEKVIPAHHFQKPTKLLYHGDLVIDTPRGTFSVLGQKIQ